MGKALLAIAIAIAVLACADEARAHHSNSLFDMASAVWIKGTVIRYEPMNPHSTITLEQSENGERRVWIVEGPGLTRLARMGADARLLAAGDIIEACVFSLRERRAADDLPALVHGHVLVLADGRLSSFGPYGKISNCVRESDGRQRWVDFIDSDKLAREAWCDRTRASLRTNAPVRDLAVEIDGALAEPCDSGVR